MPIVDVIIPFYNIPIHFAREALVSVIGQTVQDWRAIVVNDGSNEQSTSQIELLIDELADPRIEYLRTPNRGVSAARNHGIEKSSSPYIALLDPDDVFYPFRLEAGVHELEQHPEAALSHASVDVIHADGAIEKKRPRDLSYLPPDLSGQFARLLESNYVGTVTVTMRRSALDEAGVFDPSLNSMEDKELWLRMLAKGLQLRYLPRVVAQYRLHATNTSKNIEKMARGRRTLIDRVDSALRSSGSPLIPQANWQALKRSMEQHVQHEIAETYLEQNAPKDAWKSLRLRDAGWSLHTWKLKARALYRLIRR